MSDFFLVSCIIVGCYSGILLLMFFLLLRKSPGRFELQKHVYTVIVAARNEQFHLSDCINGLLRQKWQPYKILVINDHSHDQTASVVNAFRLFDSRVELLDLPEGKLGKRAALYLGAQHAETEIILTTDADCRISPNWAESMLAELARGHRMTTGPVVIMNSSSFIGRVQQVEMLFLVAGGAAWSAAGLPFQASGANMAFFRQDYILFVESERGAKFRSGDDVFFLQHLVEQYGRKSVTFNNMHEAVVETYAKKTCKGWLNQRTRWVSKAGAYSGITAYMAGAFVVMANISMWTAMVCSLIYEQYVYGALVLGAKALPEIVFIHGAARKWKSSAGIFPLLFIPLYYLPFIISVMVNWAFIGSGTWKLRGVKTLN